MPITKPDIARIRKTGATYVVIPSITLGRIENPDSLAILVYLLDKPEDWIIRRGDIMARFGIGKDRHAKAMKHLRELGLAWWTGVQDAKGRMSGGRLCVCATVGPENRTDGETRQVGETRQDGKSRQLHTTYLSSSYREKGEKEEKPKKPGPRQLPADWKPKAETIDRAIALGIELQNAEANLLEFIDYWTHSKKRKIDWDTTYLNHLKRSYDYEQKGKRNGQTTNSTQLLANNLEKALESEAAAGW